MDWIEKTIDGKPTDAYGELHFFSTRNNAKFFRLSSETKNEDLAHLLLEKWKLKKPPFIISVTGSTNDFQMNSELTRRFQKSIIETAETTGAWIVTGGTNSGVIKLVGDAVQKYTTSKNAGNIIVLGIASWRSVRDKDISNNRENQIVFYKNMEEQALNENHTHLILVDDETTEKFGGEVSLRASLERHIVREIESSAMCIIVQGRHDSLETVYQALKEGTSVVVINGSGGWANVLAYLKDVDLDKINMDLVEDIVKENNLEPTKNYPLEKLTKMVKVCMGKNDLIVVFSLHQLKSRDVHDLSKAISLSCLQSSSITEQENSKRLFEVLEKNELNIVKAYTKLKKIKPKACLQVLIEAIDKDNKNFTKLFLKMLHESKEIFDEWTLRETNLYENATWNPDKKNPIQFAQSCFGSEYKEDKSDSTIEALYRKLFLYALFSNKKSSSQILWNKMEDKLGASVAACGALAGISRIIKKKKEYMDHFQIYKDLTNGILSDCFSHDKSKTTQYLKLPMEEWGNLTCFRIIVNTKDEVLLSHKAFQEVLDELWYKDIKIPRTFWEEVFLTLVIYIGAFTFFTIPIIITFKKSQTFFPIRTKSVSSADEEQPGEGTRDLPTYFKKIYRFYQAPIVKFHLTFFFYLVFLILFGYILLFDFFQNINILEWFLFGFIVSLMVEEKRQLETLSFISWFSKPGNKLDTVGFLLYFTGFFIRLFSSIEIARVFLCLAYIVFSLRILSMFKISKCVGPQILMIEKMIKDLFLFIFIFLVVLVAYGVASQSLLYPNERSIGNVFLGVIARPYWSLYGELFLPEINYNPTSNDFTCTNDRNLIAGGHQPCPQQNSIVPILSSVYLLLTNVLLLNLLIAMFTYTLNKYVNKTDQIWKKQRCRLLEEYKQRSAVVIPFSFFVIFMKEIFQGRNKKTAFDFETQNVKNIKSSKKWLEFMKWLKEITKLYMKKKKSKEEKSEGVQIQQIRESFEMLQEKVNNIESEKIDLSSLIENIPIQQNINVTLQNLIESLLETKF